MAWTFYYPFTAFLWDSFHVVMLAFWPVYRINLWTCFSHHSSKKNNVSKIRQVTRKNGLCSQLNAAEKYDTLGPLKSLR